MWKTFSSKEHKLRYFEEIQELSDPPQKAMQLQCSQVQKRCKDISKIVHVTFSFCTKYSHSFVKWWLNPWCHIAVALLSVEGQRALVFHQKYLNLWSKDERRPHEFVLTWGEYLNDRIFIFGWTIPVRYISNICFCFRCAHPIGLHSLHEEIRDPEAVKQISSSLFLFTSILLKL